MQIKVGDDQIVDRFTKHVERGNFTKNVDDKVSKEMQELKKRQQMKE